MKIFTNEFFPLALQNFIAEKSSRRLTPPLWCCKKWTHIQKAVEDAAAIKLCMKRMKWNEWNETKGMAWENVLFFILYFLPPDCQFYAQSPKEREKSLVFEIYTQRLECELLKKRKRENEPHTNITEKARDSLALCGLSDLWLNEAHKNINKKILCWFIETMGCYCEMQWRKVKMEMLFCCRFCICVCVWEK